MSFALFLASALAGAPQALATVDNVPIFRRVHITDEVSVIAFGIIKDSRCTGPEFCFRNDTLRVAAIVSYRGQEREIVLDWDRPVQVGPGELFLMSAGTPPNPNGAIRLENYRLKLGYRPFVR
ncbi:MAG: hypothetical protein EX262_08190 [Sphingomonadaceae bacterium]|nr:MAG: hypothetical protein EX262_08190 [Sphingomonadaceae bacterium]